MDNEEKIVVGFVAITIVPIISFLVFIVLFWPIMGVLAVLDPIFSLHNMFPSLAGDGILGALYLVFLFFGEIFLFLACRKLGETQP